MAAKNSSRKRKDGRKIAVRFLFAIERYNAGESNLYYRNSVASREAWAKVLDDYAKLPPRERKRFIAVMDEFFSNAVIGEPFHPRAFLGKPHTEVFYFNWRQRDIKKGAKVLS